MFYELFCEGNNYHFRFTNTNGEVAVITLRHPLCRDQAVTLRRGAAWDAAIDADKRAIEILSANTLTLTREAMTMQREYMQGHSGVLDIDTEYGQMLFGMDIDDWDTFAGY